MKKSPIPIARIVSLFAALSLAGCGDLKGPETSKTQVTKTDLVTQSVGQSAFSRENPLYTRIALATLETTVFPEVYALESLRYQQEGHKRVRFPTISPIVALSNPGELVAQLLFEQVIFDNGRYKAGLASLKAQEAKVRAEYQIAANDAVARAVRAYLDAESFAATHAISARSHKLYRAFANQARERLQGGVGDASDVALFDLKAEEMKTSSVAAKQSQRKATATFELLTGLSLPDTTAPELNLGTVDPTHVPSYVAALAGIDIAGSEADLARAARRPSVILSARADRKESVTPEVRLGDWNLLAGRSNQKAAEASHQESQAAASKLLHNTEVRLQELTFEMTGARQSARNAKSLITFARSDIDRFEDKLTAGQSQIAEAVSVIASLHGAETSLRAARDKLLLAQLETARISGQLIPRDGGR